MVYDMYDVIRWYADVIRCCDNVILSYHDMIMKYDHIMRWCDHTMMLIRWYDDVAWLCDMMMLILCYVMIWWCNVNTRWVDLMIGSCQILMMWYDDIMMWCCDVTVAEECEAGQVTYRPICAAHNIPLGVGRENVTTKHDECYSINRTKQLNNLTWWKCNVRKCKTSVTHSCSMMAIVLLRRFLPI